MKMLKLSATLTILLLIECSASKAYDVIPYDESTMSYPVTVEQAEATVNAWIGQPSSDITLRGIGVYSGIVPLEQVYIFDANDGSLDFEVDCNSGDVCHWIDVQASNAYYAERDSASRGPELDDTVLGQTCQQFAAAHYRDFSALNLQPIAFNCFCRRLSNGVWDPANNAYVSINRYTGAIYGYSAHWGTPVTISTEPAIDQASAEAIALGAFGDMPEIRSVFILSNSGLSVERDETGLQRLAWIIDVMTSNTSETYSMEDYLYEREHTAISGIHRIVSIDAQTGEVYNRDAYLGGGGTTETGRPIPLTKPKPRPKKAPSVHAKRGKLLVNSLETNTFFPPIVDADVPYLYARHVSLVPGCVVDWKDGLVTIKGRISASFRPDSHVAIVKGRNVRLAHPVKVFLGRAYIALEVANLVSGGAFRWDKKSLTLDVRTNATSAVGAARSLK